jgi:hypothetical protein
MKVLSILRSLICRFRHPRYIIGWDKGEKGGDYWVITRILRDGNIEIVARGRGLDNTGDMGR